MAEKSTGEVNFYRSKPVLTRRDRSSFLNADGSENLSIVPVASDLLGLRPKTLQEQVEEFTRLGGASARMVYDEFINDDDFHDRLDDLEENGLSPHEVADILAQREEAKIQRFGYGVPDDATPLPDPSTEPSVDDNSA